MEEKEIAVVNDMVTQGNGGGNKVKPLRGFLIKSMGKGMTDAHIGESYIALKWVGMPVARVWPTETHFDSLYDFFEFCKLNGLPGRNPWAYKPLEENGFVSVFYGVTVHKVANGVRIEWPEPTGLVSGGVASEIVNIEIGQTEYFPSVAFMHAWLEAIGVYVLIHDLYEAFGKKGSGRYDLEGVFEATKTRTWKGGRPSTFGRANGYQEGIKELKAHMKKTVEFAAKM